jgi:hypothetical protein
MVLDIETGLVNDAKARQYLNPESYDFSSSATQFVIDVDIQSMTLAKPHITKTAWTSGCSTTAGKTTRGTMPSAGTSAIFS